MWSRHQGLLFIVSAPSGTGVASSAITWFKAQRKARPRASTWAWAPPRATSRSRNCPSVRPASKATISLTPSASRSDAK